MPKDRDIIRGGEYDESYSDDDGKVIGRAADELQYRAKGDRSSVGARRRALVRKLRAAQADARGLRQ